MEGYSYSMAQWSPAESKGLNLPRLWGGLRANSRCCSGASESPSRPAVGSLRRGTSEPHRLRFTTPGVPEFDVVAEAEVE